ncbi:MAG: hypothetical protein IKO47_07560 [Ruminococcus sp.]|nr:hypothetical protein [Ruminococcus sp.]
MMGEQFWWFYDIIVVAAIGLSMYISGGKGAMKAFSTFVAYLVAIVMALSISASVSESLAGNSIKNSNAKKISRTLESYKFTSKVAEQISGMEDKVIVEPAQLEKIYKGTKSYDAEIYKLVNNRRGKKISDSQEVFAEKLHKAYAEIVKTIVSDELGKYATEVAYKEALDDPESFNTFIPLIIDKEDRTPAAEYIAENYTKPAYRTITWLILFLILFVLILVGMLLLVNYVMGNAYHEQSLASHIGGVFIGIPKGIILSFAAAVLVRLFVVMGSDEMLFFNFKAVDKTYLFKYLYNYVADHM